MRSDDAYRHQCEIKNGGWYCFRCMGERGRCKRCGDKFTRLMWSQGLRGPAVRKWCGLSTAPSLLSDLEIFPTIGLLTIDSFGFKSHVSKVAL